MSLALEARDDFPSLLLPTQVIRVTLILAKVHGLSTYCVQEPLSEEVIRGGVCVHTRCMCARVSMCVSTSCVYKGHVYVCVCMCVWDVCVCVCEGCV